METHANMESHANIDSDEAMEELCSMMAQQPLWCAEENVLILHCSFNVTRRMLEKGDGVRTEDLHRHVREIKRRYSTMLRDVEDWLQCNGLKPYAAKVVSEPQDSMCLIYAFYIDHELIRLCDVASCDVADDG